MASIRRTKTRRWQATVCLPDGKRRSATHDTRSDARRWADETEVIARNLAAVASAATLTWSPAGLTIHIPEDLITMDAAHELERTLARLFLIRED